MSTALEFYLGIAAAIFFVLWCWERWEEPSALYETTLSDASEITDLRADVLDEDRRAEIERWLNSTESGDILRKLRDDGAEAEAIVRELLAHIDTLERQLQTLRSLLARERGLSEAQDATIKALTRGE